MPKGLVLFFELNVVHVVAHYLNLIVHLSIGERLKTFSAHRGSFEANWTLDGQNYLSDVVLSITRHCKSGRILCFLYMCMFSVGNKSLYG